MKSKITPFLFPLLIVACATAPNKNAEEVYTQEIPQEKVIEEVLPESVFSDIPHSYKEIDFPELHYQTPDPKKYRVTLSDSLTGYIVEDSSLPLARLEIFFRESTVPQSKEDIAIKELMSPMFRKGGSEKMSAEAIDDSLEFISASIGGALRSKSSSISISSLSRDFYATANLAKEIFTKPAFDPSKLEIQKAAAITAYERRYETPANVLSYLRRKVNYEKTPRFFEANAEEYAQVSAEKIKPFAQGKFNPKRVVFAFSGDLPKDSVLKFLTDYFSDWKVLEPKEKEKAEPFRFLRKPGIYAVERPIEQANISLNQPFLQRPHADYYPAVVASFILGGGGFSSRLTTRVRSDEGLAYSIYSSVGNSYQDSTLSTIALQTKAEHAPRALRLIQEEIEKLKKEGPSKEELELAKKTLIESLPSLFSSAEDIAETFADGEFVGKKLDHFDEYIREINAVKEKDVQTMIERYFDFSKMTISIVGPKISFETLPNVQILKIDSLEFRP